MHIVHNILDKNDTTGAYKWDEARKLQHKWHLGKFTPLYHPQIYLEFDKVTIQPDEYRFLVHSSMYGDGCRPTLKIQLFPGMGSLGKKHVYDFSAPLPDAEPLPVPDKNQHDKHKGKQATSINVYIRVLIFVCIFIAFQF